jgi:hypothetical protein
MKFKNLLLLVLAAGLITPAANAQNAGFAVGIQRPIINPPVAPMTQPPVTPMGQPPVQGRFPNFGVTPQIVPPIISTFPSPQLPSQVPVHRFPNAPTFVGPYRGGKDGPGYGNPGYGNRGYANPSHGNPGYGGGAYGGYNGSPYGGAYGSMYGGVYGPTIVVPNGTVVTNSTVIIQPTPAGQVVRVGPNTPPVTVTGNVVNFQNSLVGMTRDQVIRQFGSPISGVYTQSGEMLAFTGGMTVFIQNGKVVGPN